MRRRSTGFPPKQGALPPFSAEVPRFADTPDARDRARGPRGLAPHPVLI